MNNLIKVLIIKLLAIALTLPCPAAALHPASHENFDTTRLFRMAFLGKRPQAAGYITQYLAEQPDLNASTRAERWLEAAVFFAWSDSLTSSMVAYQNFLRYHDGISFNAETSANRLLFQSLILASAYSNNQAADSLLASISVRPAAGTLNRILMADSYGTLARLYKRTGDLFESSRNFDRSISLNRRIGRTVKLAEDLSDLSSILSLLNKSDQRADSVLFESLAIYRTLDTLPAIAQVYNELGVLFNRRGQFQQSLAYFKQSYMEKSKIKGLGKQEFIVVINNIGHCYQYLGNSDSARVYFSKAKDYAIQSGRNPAPYYANLGANFGGNEQFTKAIENFQKALHWLDPTCSLTDYSTNPRVSSVTPQLAEFTAYKAHSFHKRYNQLHDPQDLVTGLKTFMVALEMMDTLRFWYVFESKPYLSSEAKIHFFNALDMALDLYSLTKEKKYLEQAFQLSERNKSATLNEFIRTNQAREYIGSVATRIAQQDSIRQITNRLESRMIALSSDLNSPADTITFIKTRLSDLTDELKNIGIEARRENPEYFRKIYTNQGYLPGEIQQLIIPGEAMIDYTVVHDFRLNLDFMVVMVLTRDTLFTYRDTLPKHFRKEIEAFRETITSYVDTRIFLEFSKLSNLMYQYFFKPIEKFKGIDKLIILPDEELGFLPFEVFVSDTIRPGGSDFRKLSYLNRKYQISYISSHEQLFQFRKQSAKREKTKVYAFAPFVSKGARIDTLTVLSLNKSDSDIKVISKYFRTRKYINKQATEQSLRQAFQKSSVISLNTHGIMDPLNPMQSRLLLNPSEPDCSLYLFEMIPMKIRSSLVILNACNTGTGLLQVGEGILSMARGFQFAGVPSVITTLWPIDDQSSSAVMKYFFKNLKDGMAQREALTEARNQYIDQANKATGAPYFWAGHVLIGDPGSISIQKRSNPLILISFILFAGAFLTFLIIQYKKRR